MIDPHVHCRDGKQAYKETIKHTFQIAENQGVEKIFDMPNTKPPILTENEVKKRLKLVPKAHKKEYFLYIGASSIEKQLEEAVRCYNEYEEIIGIKLYAGKSVGDLAVIKESEQKKVYRTLSNLNYKDVIAVHCEKENYLKPRVWNPSNPITHSYARPKKAEIESIKDQIKFVKETNFKGILHIVHVTCPESVELINKAKKEIKITCGVTPHHILWSNERMKRPDGLLYKMNPPLRDNVKKLRELLRSGKIDWIETDHAPHPIGEKLSPPYSSGYPSLYLYKKFVKEFLPSLGVDRRFIKKLTFENIKETFKSELL